MNSKLLRQRFKELHTSASFWSVRCVEQHSEQLSVRQGIAQPIKLSSDRGAMVSVIEDGSFGYCATSDLSLKGLQSAIDRASLWARTVARVSCFDFGPALPPPVIGEYRSPRSIDTPISRCELLEALRTLAQSAKIDARIVDWEASIERLTFRSIHLTGSGGEVTQEFEYLMPNLSVTAYTDGEAQTRSLAGPRGVCQQGGMEILRRFNFFSSAPRLAEEALQLLAAPNCPSGNMDLVLMPDQMMLQIHESIGHPLELDRILGDERNFAGGSFVTLDMFGSYQYGSPLLNVTFDPTRREEFASYGFDDDAGAAAKVYLIRDGVLQCSLGGHLSQARSGLPGVANSRASSWNRPPIDRMANINVEPGASTLDEMIASVRRGVLMSANISWSIDDMRNKFQFGCEWGQLIENGKLTTVVKNSNYRGISANFWRSLRLVGNADTAQILGTPNCGKGEPNQLIRVGHASPACVFSDVEVFGGVQ